MNVLRRSPAGNSGNEEEAATGNPFGSLSPDDRRIYAAAAAQQRLQRRREESQQAFFRDDECYHELESAAAAAAATTSSRSAASTAPVRGQRSTFLFGDGQSDEDLEDLPMARSEPRDWLPQPQSRPAGIDQHRHPVPSAILLASTAGQPDETVDGEAAGDDCSGADRAQKCAAEDEDGSPQRSLWLTDGLVDTRAKIAASCECVSTQTDDDRILRDAAKQCANESAQTQTEQPASCAACDKLRGVMTVPDGAGFEDLQAQWQLLSKMFRRFEATCQQVLGRANALRAEKELQDAAQRSWRVESDIRTGVLKLVGATEDEDDANASAAAAAAAAGAGAAAERSASAIERMRVIQAAATSASFVERDVLPAATTATRRPLHAVTTPPSVVTAIATRSGNDLAAPASAGARAPDSIAIAANPAAQKSGSGPLHFVALRKCLVKQPTSENRPPRH